MTLLRGGLRCLSSQSKKSERIATLEKGEMLTPIAESIGSEIWYIVRSKQGLVGWVRAAFRQNSGSDTLWYIRSKK